MSQPVQDHRRRGRGRLVRIALVGALSAGALGAVPAAQADNLSVVRAHVRSADAALHQVVAATGAPSSLSASVSLAALESQLKAAGAGAAKLVHGAHKSSILRVRAATALTKLAAQQTRDITSLTPLVGSLSGSASGLDVVSFIASVTQSQQQVLTLASQILSKLPVADQSQVAGVVAQLSNLGSGQVGQLAGGLSAGSVACPAIASVSQVVATALASVQANVARVQSLLSFLPAGAASQFTSVLTGLPAQLNALVASLNQAFSCSSTTPVTGVTGVTGTIGNPAAAVTSLIGSVTQLVQSLLGSFLPAIGAGTTTSPVSIPTPVSGLLSQVTSLVPGLGSLLGGGATGGFLGGLLGGLGGLGG
jgi:hypothetical protein